MAIKKEIEIVVNADRAEKKLKEVNNSINQSDEATKGLTSSLDNMTGGAITGFKGIVSGVKSGIAAMKSLKVAIAATGIGLLVIAVGSLISYFTKTEEGAGKLRIVFEAVGAVISKLVDGLVAVGKFLTRVASITGEVIKGNKSLTEGWNEAKEAGKEMGREIVDAYSNIGSAVSKAIELQQRENQLRKDQREALTEEARLLVALSEARTRTGDATLTNQERIAALNEAQQINNKLIDGRIERLREEYEIQKQRNALASSSEEDLQKEAQLQADLISLEAERNTRNKEFIDQRASLVNQEKAILESQISARKAAQDEFSKSLQDEIDAEILAEEKKQEGIAAIQEKYRLAQQDLEDTTEEQKILRQQERSLAELEALDATEEQKQEIRDYYANLLDKNEEEQAKKREEREKLVQQSKLAIASSVFGIVESLAKEGSRVAKGAAASQATINTYEGITSTLAAPTTIPEPFGTVLKIANAAKIGVMGFANVKKILSTDSSGKTSGSSASASTGTTTTSTRTAPSFNLVSGTGSNQIAEGIAAQNQKPVRTYVVSSEVSTNQELDRKIINNASL